MKGTLGALLLALLLLAGVAALLAQMELDFRLDALLPEPATAEQALITDRLGDSPAARMILVAVGGSDARTLAHASDVLAERLPRIDHVARVDNGRFDLDSEAWGPLMEKRLFLAPDPARLTDRENVVRALEERLVELSLAGSWVEPLIRRDPLGIVADATQDLVPAAAPVGEEGLWFSRDGRYALLVVDTDVAAFDLEAQGAIVGAIHEAFESLPESADLELVLTGPPVFAVENANRARADGRRLSLLAGAWILLVLLVAWRRLALVLAGAVPLLGGVLVGLVALSAGYPAIHGLTLAFGFTLLGVAIDYPVHLVAHHEGDGRRAARRIALPLLLGAASSLLAYGAIWLSTSPGLAQLGAFSAVGLLGAALITLGLGPWLPPRPAPGPPALVRRLVRLPRLPWLPGLLLLASAIGLAAMGGRLWSDDLAALSPVEGDRLALDQRLRSELGAGEVRYLVAVQDRELETVLRRTEALEELLAEARADGLVGSWQSVVRLVPSQTAQEARRAAWPDPDTMAHLLERASADVGFRAGAFEPFVEDLRRLEAQPPVGPEDWRSTPFASLVETLLERREEGWRSLVVLAGIADPEALASWLERRQAPASLLDLKAVSERMVRGYRREVLASLGVALLLIVGLLMMRLRSARTCWAVLQPPLAAVALVALLTALAGGISIVHLVGLILVAGIGLDYALFLQRLMGDREVAARTLWAVALCAASTGGVFLILASSSIGLLADLGATASTGILLAATLAWLSRKDTPAGSGPWVGEAGR